ncbi:hypothetical protein YC2023_082625 [Brassica napus]
MAVEQRTVALIRFSLMHQKLPRSILSPTNILVGASLIQNWYRNISGLRSRVIYQARPKARVQNTPRQGQTRRIRDYMKGRRKQYRNN